MSAASGATTRARTLASEIEALAPKTGNDANAATVGTQVRILALAWRAQRQAGAEADKRANAGCCFRHAGKDRIAISAGGCVARRFAIACRWRSA